MKWMLTFLIWISGASHANPPVIDQIEGVVPGASWEQVINVLGPPMRCADRGEVKWCAWENADEQVLTGSMIADRLTYLFVAEGYSPGSTLGFRTIADLRDAWGAESIYSRSEGGARERLTYLNEGLDSGVTVNFDEGRLIGYGIGEVTWRASGTVAEYRVMGEAWCPSEKCPFVLPSKRVKPQYQQMTVGELIRQGH